ncbi:MAG: hypothetical protein ABI193_20885, partial [Minicystis sp.]
HPSRGRRSKRNERVEAQVAKVEVDPSGSPASLAARRAGRSAGIGHFDDAPDDGERGESFRGEDALLPHNEAGQRGQKGVGQGKPP